MSYYPDMSKRHGAVQRTNGKNGEFSIVFFSASVLINDSCLQNHPSPKNMAQPGTKKKKSPKSYCELGDVTGSSSTSHRVEKKK